MEQKYKKLIYLLITSLVAVLTGVGCKQEVLPSRLTSLVYPGGYNVKNYIQPSSNLESITYKVNLSYPSLKIVEYYQKKLLKMGYQICPDFNFSPERSKKNWPTHSDQTDGYFYRLLYRWVNKNETEMITLLVQYGPLRLKTPSDTPDNIQHVMLQVNSTEGMFKNCRFVE